MNPLFNRNPPTKRSSANSSTENINKAEMKEPPQKKQKTAYYCHSSPPSDSKYGFSYTNSSDTNRGKQEAIIDSTEPIIANSNDLGSANYRAQNRIDGLINNFPMIFNIENNLKKKYCPEYYVYNGKKSTIKEYYLVTVRDNIQSNITFKNMLKFLQVYNSTDDLKYTYLNGRIPIIVRLNIWNRQRDFAIFSSLYPTCQQNQIAVATRSKQGTFVFHTYSSLVKNITVGLNHTKQIQLAKLIIDSLNNNLDNQPNFLEIIDESKHNFILELIVATQVAESNHGRDTTKSRTPGMDKLARAIFMKIAAGISTFEDAFGGDEPLYTPSGKGGTGKTRGKMNYIANTVKLS